MLWQSVTLPSSLRPISISITRDGQFWVRTKRPTFLAVTFRLQTSVRRNAATVTRKIKSLYVSRRDIKTERREVVCKHHHTGANNDTLKKNIRDWHHQTLESICASTTGEERNNRQWKWGKTFRLRRRSEWVEKTWRKIKSWNELMKFWLLAIEFGSQFDEKCCDIWFLGELSKEETTQ